MNSKVFATMILLLLFSSISFAKDFGVSLFSQNVNTNITLSDKNDTRYVDMTPEPPSFDGVSVTYKGFGLSLQKANTDLETRSSASAFKTTFPWRRFFVEMYHGQFEGVDVKDIGFRDDVDVTVTGLHFLVARNPKFSFGSVFGLEKAMWEVAGTSRKSSFLSFSLQETIWRGDSSFILPMNNDDELAFYYLRRTILTSAWGGAYVRYGQYGRFAAVGNIGPYIGQRQLRYHTRESVEGSEIGYNLSAGISLASDLGFHRMGMKTGLHCNYGLNFIIHTTGSFDDIKVSTTQSSSVLYIGALF